MVLLGECQAHFLLLSYHAGNMERQEGQMPLPEAVVAQGIGRIEKPIVVEMAEIAAKEFVKEIIPDELKPRGIAAPKSEEQPILPIFIGDDNRLEAVRSELQSLTSIPEQSGKAIAQQSGVMQS
jgi:hypothetical protein